MMIRIKSNLGLTFLETVSALVVVMVTLGFVLVNSRTGLQNYRLNASALEIAGQIQSARYRALRNNVMCSFLSIGTTFGIDVDGDGNITSGTQDLVLNLGNGITFTNAAAPPLSGATCISPVCVGPKNGVGFTPRGTLTPINSSTGQPNFTAAFPASGVAIYLTNATGRFAAITVSPAGRVRTWKSGNSSTWNY